MRKTEGGGWRAGKAPASARVRQDLCPRPHPKIAATATHPLQPSHLSHTPSVIHRASPRYHSLNPHPCYRRCPRHPLLREDDNTPANTSRGHSSGSLCCAWGILPSKCLEELYSRAWKLRPRLRPTTRRSPCEEHIRAETSQPGPNREDGTSVHCIQQYHRLVMRASRSARYAFA